jgi:hypothetical protein
MTAGTNARCTIWRINYSSDDEVGGAVVTGTAMYTGVQTRLDEKMASQLLLQQGLETVKTFTAVIVPGDLDIRDRDEYEITDPLDHRYFGKRFRIIGSPYSSHSTRDPRNYQVVNLVRSVRAHDRQ